MYLTTDKLQDSGIGPGKIRRLAELFPAVTALTAENFQEAGFNNEDIVKVFDIIYGPHMTVRAAYLTKERLQEAAIDPQIIQKFAELFPNGTEVTRELCEKHPDIFSFGRPPPFRGIEMEHRLKLVLAMCKAKLKAQS